MDLELRQILNTILANQAVLYQRIDTLYSKNKGITKSFFNEDAAAKELKELSDKLLKDASK